MLKGIMNHKMCQRFYRFVGNKNVGDDLSGGFSIPSLFDALSCYEITVNLL